MLRDIEDGPTYQRLVQKGREEGVRQSALDLVQTRFPSLHTLAEKQLGSITDLEILHQAVVQIGIAKTARSARQYLLDLKA